MVDSATEKDSKINYIQEVIDIHYKGSAAALARDLDETKPTMSRAMNGTSDKALDRIWRKVNAEYYLQDKSVVLHSANGGEDNITDHVSLFSVLTTKLTPTIKSMIEKAPALKDGGEVFSFTFPIEVDGDIYDVQVSSKIVKRAKKDLSDPDADSTVDAS